MNQKLLIISYTFPPTGGIGGRRWAKFAKYLLRKGIDVQVLAAKHTQGPVSDWQHDISRLEQENRITYFDSLYPSYLGIQPAGLFEKLAYRASLLYAKLRLKGNYYDRSAHCKTRLLPLIEQFIARGYNNILVSVGPFMYAAYVAELKSKYPHINLILDVRDPWTNNKTSFGYENLEPARFNYEKKAEKQVAETYNHIIAVADDINDYFRDTYNIPAHRFVTVKNGFDTEDFPGTRSHTNNHNLRLVFTGTVYNKALKYVGMLAAALQALRQSNPEAYAAVSCDFYGIIPAGWQETVKQEKAIRFHGNIPLNEVYEQIAASSACMLFLTDDLNYSFSTKFYEYLSQKKPVIVFSSGGKTGAFVEENGIGLSVTPENINAKLEELYSRYKDHRLTVNTSFDVNAFSVEHLSDQIIPLLKQQ